MSKFFILFLIASFVYASEEKLDPYFIGKWEAISRACIEGSALSISANEFKMYQEKPFRFHVVRNDKELGIWIENLDVNSENRYWRLTRDKANQIQVSWTHKLDVDPKSEQGLSMCWYIRSAPKKKVKGRIQFGTR